MITLKLLVCTSYYRYTYIDKSLKERVPRATNSWNGFFYFRNGVKTIFFKRTKN